MTKKFKKGQRGITLIALVVTIIVLLILAGIAVSSITGNDGVLDMASESKNKSKIRQAEDDIKLKLQEALIRSSGNITIHTFMEVLNEDSENYVVRTDTAVATLQVGDDGTGITDVNELNNYTGDSLFVTNLKFGVEVELDVNDNFNVIGSTDFSNTASVASNTNADIEQPEIILSTEEWTNQPVEIEVDFKNAEANQYRLEISLDGGTTYRRYTGKVTTDKNITVVARARKNGNSVTAEKQITNIDMLSPKNATLYVGSDNSKTAINLYVREYYDEYDADIADEEENEEYGNSGIIGYIGYVYKDGTEIFRSDLIKKNWVSWRVNDLTPLTEYDFYIEVYDNAGNVTRSQTVTYTKKDFYKWNKYRVSTVTNGWAETSYTTSVSVYPYNYNGDISQYPYIVGFSSRPTPSSHTGSNGSTYAYKTNTCYKVYPTPSNVYGKYIENCDFYSSSTSTRRLTTWYYLLGNSHTEYTESGVFKGYTFYDSTYTYASQTTESNGSTIKGSSVGTVTSQVSNAYPDDGIQDGFWYVKQE